MIKIGLVTDTLPDFIG